MLASLLLTLLYVLLGLVGLVLAVVFFVPLRLDAWAVSDEDVDLAEAQVSWLLGALRFQASTEHGVALRLFGVGLTLPRGQKKKDHDRDEKKRAKKRARKEAKTKGRRRGLGARLWRERKTLVAIARRLVASLRLRLRVVGRFGFEEPWRTAQVMQIAAELADVLPEGSLDLTPDYLETGFEGSVEVGARLWVAHLFITALHTLIEPRTWRLLRAVRSNA